MKPGLLLPMSLVVLLTAPVLAQGTANDRLTGTWTGYIGRSAANPSAITFEMSRRPDGSLTGTASGPQLTPGDVVAGDYDPATGALKFEVVIRGSTDENGRVRFDGRVVHDTASGTVIINGENGVFRLVRQDPAAKSAPASLTPPALTGDPSAAARRGFVEVSDWITRAAEMVPAERYTYRPVGTVRTFGQLVAHLVDAHAYYCGRAAGRNVQWTDDAEKNATTKPALTQALAKALADCKSVYEGTGDIAPLMENLVHSGLHYGNMVTYLRMLGLTPPSS